MIHVTKQAVYAPYGSKLVPELVVTRVEVFGFTVYRAKLEGYVA
ncbi:hypothetical protein HOR67_gp37 [Ralstonia phage RS-PI-1]|uniref:Uncharacterized protein n=1 Tax=Ralstonia phage RS-PI-1 TaxID=1958965 RepID=A0A1S6L1D9_9CAUD|nr:hypothetical protein HOR67_gp37 [Ralstonia phage RS-PI-1]AQT27799.1 hypothetical protein [Ralstonia phage RS-PI-1]